MSMSSMNSDGSGLPGALVSMLVYIKCVWGLLDSGQKESVKKIPTPPTPLESEITQEIVS